MYPEPSAPPLNELFNGDDVVYGCEDGCDVEFLVGTSPDNLMRIPGHICKLRKFPVFGAMFSDNFCTICITTGENGRSKMRQITLNNMDGKGFDNLMKFIYGKPVNLQSVETMIETLKAAHQLMFPGLVRTCVKKLREIMSLSNVLFIYSNVFHLCSDLKNLEELTKTGCSPVPKRNKSSADQQLQDHFSAGLEMKESCLRLLCKTLEFIDIHAAKVFELDDVEELDRNHLKFLVKRDSLRISEIDLFFALNRWAETVCKRQLYQLTPSSKRQALGNLVYYVRYFQMTSQEFHYGPVESGLLNPEEVELIRNMVVHGRPRFNTGHHKDLFPNNLECGALRNLKRYWDYMSRPRFPRLDIDTGKNANGKRRNSKTGRKVSIVIKRYCLPCAYNNKTTCWEGTHSSSNIVSSQHHQKKNVKNEAKSLKRRPSTFSKVLDCSLTVFAFFFD